MCFNPFIDVFWTLYVTVRVNVSLPVIGVHVHAGTLAITVLASVAALISMQFKRKCSTVG